MMNECSLVSDDLSKITCVPRNRCTEKNVMLCVYAKVLKKKKKIIVLIISKPLPSKNILKMLKKI